MAKIRAFTPKQIARAMELIDSGLTRLEVSLCIGGRVDTLYNAIETAKEFGFGAWDD